ncbi:MAG: ATP-dependent zinc metalloprotease FtsH [Eubacteriales bacterium]|nr:ATP-dependent zinc metalloprotease FtsH [Eubacteriales bacterium]
MKYLKGYSIYIVLFIIILFIVAVNNGGVKPETMDYSQLLSEVKAQNVSQLVLDGENVYVKLKNKDNAGYSLVLPDRSYFIEWVTPYVEDKQFQFVTEGEDTMPWWLSTILPTLGLILVFVLFWVFFLQQPQGGAGGNRVMSFGKSRARLNTDDKKKVTFNDVAGADEEKEELEEIVEFLKQPKKFIELGARIPKGVLLVGPPGTGKTLLAKAVSGEAGVPFFSISGSDFVEMFVGVGASRVRDLFEQAKKNAPCIVFIDEIDAVGRHRGAGMGGGHDEREQTLNQLLVEMDGFGVNEGVIILAATNRPDILDPALLRPGRFDRRVAVGLPDIKGREEILKVHSRGKPLHSEVKLEHIAKITPGFTGADLENLLNESALLAARKQKKEIEMADIKEAIYKVMIGPEKRSKVMSENDKKVTAYHEAGHAITARLMSTTEKVDRVSIIPAGFAGGYTTFKPEDDKAYMTKSQLMEEIYVSLGGKAAEDVVLGEISTGSYGDLKKANKVARSMVTKYGMSEKVGNLILGDENDEIFVGRDFAHFKGYSEELSAVIDKEVKNIIDTSYDKVTSILRNNINKLHNVANALLDRERLEGPEFEEIFAKA